jgi:hypothetical protein
MGDGDAFVALLDVGDVEGPLVERRQRFDGHGTRDGVEVGSRPGRRLRWCRLVIPRLYDSAFGSSADGSLRNSCRHQAELLWSLYGPGLDQGQHLRRLRAFLPSNGQYRNVLSFSECFRRSQVWWRAGLYAGHCQWLFADLRKRGDLAAEQRKDIVVICGRPVPLVVVVWSPMWSSWGHQWSVAGDVAGGDWPVLPFGPEDIEDGALRAPGPFTEGI